jgi:carbonic anhydrase
MSDQWGYQPENGPDNWAKLGFEIAVEGERQERGIHLILRIKYILVEM